MKKVISTAGFETSEGMATQITLPNGNYWYTGVNSVCQSRAKDKNMPITFVHYFGACIYSNINQRAHMKFPIQIDGVSIADFIEKVATEEDCATFLDS
jgi:hypothetical protein